MKQLAISLSECFKGSHIFILSWPTGFFSDKAILSLHYLLCSSYPVIQFVRCKINSTFAGFVINFNEAITSNFKL